MTLTPIVMSGGIGARLWPLSRQSHPKPFIALPGGGTLIGKTHARLAALPDVGEIVTVTNRDLMFLTADAYAETGARAVSNRYLLEPQGRDTAAAVALAALDVAARQGETGTVLVAPADHLIADEAAFAVAVARARTLAEAGRIVTFGVVPTRPETGFGYIDADGETVRGFVEKPDLATAERYVADGAHLWNAGIFCFQAGVMIAAMQQHCPDILSDVRAAYDAAPTGRTADSETREMGPAAFAAVRAISVDRAVMEKADNIACVALDCGWSDVGTWSAFSELVAADAEGNRTSGEVATDQARDCFVLSGDRLVGLVGVSDLLVVDTPDALMIARRGADQDVKRLAETLTRQGHEAARLHRTAHRPWGTYTVLEEGEGFKIKRIVVRPHGRLSLQSHKHRSEHWVVVSGTAEVVNGDQVLRLETNQSTYIPSGHRHRLSNPTDSPLVLIEVQSGPYLGEDDIERYDDVYGRS